MRPQLRLTLGQASALGLLGLALLLAGLFWGVMGGSQKAIVVSSGPLRDALGKFVGGQVEGYLQSAEDAVGHVEHHLLLGTCVVESPRCAEEALFLEILANRALAEAAFTHGHGDGRGKDVGLDGRWQVSVSRLGDGALLTSRFTHPVAGRFVADLEERPEGHGLQTPPSRHRREPARDPTLHATFVTPASEPESTPLLWSDLSYLELDAPLPESKRRVVKTVMRAVRNGSGAVVGVIRAALLEEELDRKLLDSASGAMRLFIADGAGRLVTRLSPGDPIREVGEETLRVVPQTVSPEIARALADPALGDSQPGKPRSAAFEVGGRRFLASFRGLDHTFDWHLGIVVAEDLLPGIPQLESTQKDLLTRVGIVIVVILLGGALAVRTIQTDLGRIVLSTARMGDFDFAPRDTRSSLKDVEAVMEGLERAKTALRAMGKYVPIDLVRLLYRSGREPVLGGELHDVSLMFTDIMGFTALSEQMSPDELARFLGRYFEAMTTTIQEASGTVDKFIGDAVMALWNVPLPSADHPQKACAAALACVEATERLYRSAEWAGMPPLLTRFGLHRGTVMVGHFGAPDRLSYTALGDGVNLASRLEGLNKQYGTAILVSESIHEGARDLFAFRRLDRVAVKGKTRGIEVYELVGRLPWRPEEREMVAHYEGALEAYWARDFASALKTLEESSGDKPSQVLAERCRRMLKDPPPPTWDGVFVATFK